MSAPKGNQFAAKPEGEAATSNLHIRCTPADKGSWVRAAQARAIRDPNAGDKLAEWVTDILNAAAAAELSADKSK